MRALLIILLLGGLPLLSTGQLLDSLELRLIQHNPELKAMEKEVEAARARIDLAGARPNPQLRAGVLALPTQPGVGMEQLSLSASQMFPQAGVLKYRSRSAEALASSQQAAYRAMLQQKLLQLRQTYYALYGFRKQQLSLRASRSNLEALEPILLKAYSAGRSPLSEVLQLRARLLNLDQKLQLNEAEIVSRRAAIIQLSGGDLPGEIMLPDTLLPELSDYTSVDSLEAREHPVVNTFISMQKAQEYESKLARRMARPMLGAGLQYMRMANGMSGLMPMLMVEVPLWRKKNEALLDESQALTEAYAYRAEAGLNQLQETYRTARQQLSSAITRLELTREQLKLQESILQQLQTELAAGSSSLQTLLNQQNEYLDLKLDAEMALVDLMQAEAQLRYIMNQQ